MIKIFSDKKAAQDLCNKIHQYLQENCVGYNAAKWQDPSSDEKGLLFYVQLPKEYDFELNNDKEMYPVKEYITLSIKPECDKATSTVDKLPIDWKLSQDTLPLKNVNLPI